MSASRARGRWTPNNSDPQRVPHVRSRLFIASYLCSNLPLCAPHAFLFLRTSPYLSLSLALSFPPPLPSFPLRLSSSCAHLSLPDSLCPSISISHCLPLHPFSSLSSPLPLILPGSGSEPLPEPGRLLEVLDSWSAEKIKRSGQLADDQSESGSQDWLIFIDRIGGLYRYWPVAAGRGQEASGLFCVMWKPALRVSESRSVLFFYVELLSAIPASCAEAIKKINHLLVCWFPPKKWRLWLCGTFSVVSFAWVSWKAWQMEFVMGWDLLVWPEQWKWMKCVWKLPFLQCRLMMFAWCYENVKLHTSALHLWYWKYRGLLVLLDSAFLAGGP